MSLVEQAAQRLAELRKSGADISGELSQAADSPAAQASGESIIERAANKLDKRQAGRDPAPAAALPRAINESFLEWPQEARREPHLSDLEQAEPDATVRETPARVSRGIALDPDALAAQGFLVPGSVDTPLANELRQIKRPLINNCRGKGVPPVHRGNRIMITSALPGEGKSFVALNLAISIGLERDSTVLLIDADTTRPCLSRLLGVPPARGLLDLLTDARLDPAEVLLRTSIERLSFLPAGTLTPNATELLASKAMEELAGHLAARYTDRILIIDTPPLLAAPEPPVLAGHMGQIIFVVEAGKTTHRSTQQALAAVEACPLVMTVLNKASASRNGYYYASVG